MHIESQQQAILNEVKGNLFEYLVAHKMAQEEGRESFFLRNLPNALLEMLRYYDGQLRKYHPHLLQRLPLLANALAQQLMERLKGFEEIYVVGKIAGAFHNQTFSEGDIVLKKAGELIPLSIKLARHGSLMNTKSGGLGSFIKQYFPCSLSSSLQKRFNDFLEERFQHFAFQMHELYDLESTGDFSVWKEQQLPLLPGSLKGEAKEVLLEYYAAMSSELHEALYTIYKNETHTFLQGLPKLMGFGQSNIIQAVCFHQDYQLKSCQVKLVEDLKLFLSDLSFPPHPQNAHNFSLLGGGIQLQIRVKPMNTFITKSFKVNCSIRFDGH